MEYQIKYRRKIGRWPTVIPVGADSIRPQGPCKDRIDVGIDPYKIPFNKYAGPDTHIGRTFYFFVNSVSAA